MSKTTYTVEEWRKKAVELFGDDPLAWAFKCPMCGHIQTVKDFKDAGLDPGSACQGCIGRHQDAPEFVPGGTGPCNWAAYGLFKITNTVVVTEDGHKVHVFDFADPAEVKERAA